MSTQSRPGDTRDDFRTTEHWVLNKLPKYLAILGLVLMSINMYFIFVVAPTDIVLGNIQRIFYIHVPMAIMSFLGFFIVFLGSLGYFGVWNHIRIYKVLNLKCVQLNTWDAIAHSAAEVGVIFVTLALITGVIWAKPVWGTWWTWEPRLTTTLILWLIYVSYLMLRTYATNKKQGAVYSAVIGIIGFVDVPIVYYSVVWWRSIHPSAVLGPFAESNSLDPTMNLILLFSFLTISVLFTYLLLERIALRKTEDDLSQFKLFAQVKRIEYGD